MSNINTTITVQAVGGTVGGTVESSRGTIDVRYADYATLFVDYVKGTEGTIYVYPKWQHTLGGTSYAWQGWGTLAEGDVTATANRLKLTANGSAYKTFDVRGQSYMDIQSLVVGTPSGALGLYLVLEGDE
jgi:hypothetical protein